MSDPFFLSAGIEEEAWLLALLRNAARRPAWLSRGAASGKKNCHKQFLAFFEVRWRAPSPGASYSLRTSNDFSAQPSNAVGSLSANNDVGPASWKCLLQIADSVSSFCEDAHGGPSQSRSMRR